MRPIIIISFILLITAVFTACTYNKGNQKTTYKNERIIVDDRVITSNDEQKVIEPLYTKSENINETLDSVRAMPFGLFEYKDGYIYYNPIDKPDTVYKVNINGIESARPAKKDEIPINTDKQIPFDPTILFAGKQYIHFYCSYDDWVFYSNYSDMNKLYLIRQDGSNDQKVLDVSTCDFFICDGQLYYIDQTGTEYSFENNITLFNDSKEDLPPGFKSFGKIKSFNVSEKLENVRLKQILSDNGIFDEERHPIDVEYERAMANPDVWTTAGMTETTCQYGDMWKAEMEKYLELLIEKLADNKKKWVMESQKKWEVFTKDNEELAWQVYDQINHGGSIMSNHTASIYYDKYRTRALYLKSLYDFLTFDR